MFQRWDLVYFDLVLFVFIAFPFVHSFSSQNVYSFSFLSKRFIFLSFFYPWLWLLVLLLPLFCVYYVLYISYYWYQSLNGLSTDGPLYVYALYCTSILVHVFRISLWQFIFFHVALFSCCTLFMLHFFHFAPFSCCTFFRAALLFCTISSCTFTRCDVFVLHSSPVALFLVVLCSCCTISRGVARGPINI